ncbi:MAG: 2-phospho-L-lactate transferase [Spongiibacteraceae bacterium]
MSSPKKKYLALSGGVGGAKLAVGLAHLLAPEQLTIVCNTGDDFDHYGLRICPDLDSVMYALAGRNDNERGWGLADESWRTLDQLGAIGGDTWFRLGDLDIATHLLRSDELRRGNSLSSATKKLCAGFGIQHTLIPMSDDAVATIVETSNDDGTSGVDLNFQHYFVREQCKPTVRGFYFEGIDRAKPHPQLSQPLLNDDIDAVIICPSNPFVSIDPILQLSGVREALKNTSVPVIAVSPIVGGNAIKGPAAKMLRELNYPSSAFAVANYYRDILDGFVIDHADADHVDAISELGIAVHATASIMKTLDDRIQLAQAVLQFASALSDDQ